MSIILHYPCPQCGCPFNFALGAVCSAPFKGGLTCGYSIPQILTDFNSTLTRKVEKHTQEPTGAFNGSISFHPSTGFYLQNREAAFSGAVYMDKKENYFCTYITPSGDNAIATVCVGNAANRLNVSGYKMPLNSRVKNLHGHYANHEGMLFVATPDGVVIEPPDNVHPNIFQVFQSGRLIAGWDSAAGTG